MGFYAAVVNVYVKFLIEFKRVLLYTESNLENLSGKLGGLKWIN